MTDLATALASSDKLEAYKGRDVLRTSIAIRNAGDGLSAAMAIDPVELTIGDTVFVVLECEVVHHDHFPIKDTDCLELKQILRAEGATLVDEDLVRAHLDAQAERIRAARDAAAGVSRLTFTDDNGGDDDGDDRFEMETAEALAVQHRSGAHADGPRNECPMCEDGFE